MNHTKIILALALLVLFLYTASAAPIDGNTTDSNAIPAGNGYIYITSNPSGADVYIVDLDVNKDYYFYYGKTPVGTLLAARTFKIIVKMDGYKDYTTELIISEYGSTLLRVELQKSDANAAGYGKVKVTSSPSKADVYLDGRYAGITPLGLSEVSVGTHTVEVKLANYNPYKKVIKISKNRSTPVHAKLKKISTKKSTKSTKKSAKTTGAVAMPAAFGKLQITSDPSGATVWLTNVGLNVTNMPGQTPLEMEVDVGTYKIVVEMGGYTSYIKTIKISADKTAKVYAKLKKATAATGKLKVTTSPSKADAYIRDSGVGEWSSIGKTPVTKSLAAGSYEVSVKKKGYLESRQKVSVSAKKTTFVKIKMLKETKAKCTDYDGGKDYYVKSYATDNLTTKVEDSCASEASGGDTLFDTHILYEAYCDSRGKIRTETYKCSEGCEDGACIKPTTKCDDSDSGQDFYTKGTVKGTAYDGSYYEETDNCNDSGEPFLIEFYCYDSATRCITSGPISGTYCSLGAFCENGCKDGACLKEATLCGNGTIDAGEECDGNAGLGATCGNFGYTEGTITCSSTCKYIITCT